MMNTKMTAAIEKITLNAATFAGVSVKPTLINFFYGNNATGKSTIARAIHSDDGLVWQQGKSAFDYSVLVYNQEFVAANFENYGNLKGVFSIGEQNIEVQAQIDEKNRQRAELDRIIAEKSADKERKEMIRNNLFNNFQDDCWDETKALRKEFDIVQSGYKRKVQFAEKVLQLVNPTQHDIEELKILYKTAFDPEAATYKEFQPTGALARLKGSPGNKLLGKSIMCSSDTPFASFIKAIKATDWVRQGYERYTKKTGGRCPYCQRKLPDDFEKQISVCFDEQYQEDINALRQFQGDYASDMHSFINILKGNLQNAFPQLDLTEYKSKVALLEKTIEINLQRIADKLKESSIVVTLENVKTLRDEINVLIEGFNRQIQNNNAVVNAKQQKQTECRTKVWELIAYTLQNKVSIYKTGVKNLNNEILELGKSITDSNNAIRDLETDIAELNKHIVTTAPTIKSINSLLRDAGFTGFALREKRGQQNVYEVIRQDGSIANNLSEGERNFITFLYFYHLVRGTHTDSDAGKGKIVVIDDPVTGMDSSVLFIVSALVREMIGVCRNNVAYLDVEKTDSYIKQIFILTHNIYFHREITYNQIHLFNYVSFFVVNKANNNSTVRLCVRQHPKILAEQENFNPVQSSYAALWSEYKEVTTAISIKNVMRRILEYYFMQLCGYGGEDIRKMVLDNNREKFVDVTSEGLPDNRKYHLASAMLSYIGVKPAGLGDGLNYVDDCDNITLYKDVFKLIFQVMHQGQHYKMMMGEDMAIS